MPKNKKQEIPALEEEKVISKCDYSDDEVKYRGYLIDRMTKSDNQRTGNYPEFDDMDYMTYYEENSKAAYSYLREKQNKEDVRIVTGTTMEKETTLLSALLNFNFDSTLTAFDEEDLMLNEMGWVMSDMVRKSKQIDQYDAKRPLYYKEGLDQGTAFVEELFVERTNVIKTLDEAWSTDGVKNLKTLKWTTRLEKALGECQSNLLSGTKVYLGNIREFFIWNQPYVFIRDILSYDEAKTLYGEWERFEYVPKKVVKVGDDKVISYRDWTLIETEGNMVEVIKYFDKWNNEFMIFLNGVMMLPIGFPLTAVSPSGEIPLAKLDAEALNRFWAYSKSIPAKMKVDQQVLDEFLRLMILKTRQSFKPPMVNNTNRILSRDIFLGGKITQGIGKGQLYSLLEGQLGVTQGEFQVFQLIKQLVNEKTVNPVFSGDQTKSGTTATEVQELKKQQLMKLGWIVLGIMEFERQLTWLRIHNICANWTTPVDSKIDEYKNQLVNSFRSINLESTDQEEEASKIIEFNPEKTNTMSPDQVLAEEEILSNSIRFPGKKVKKVYVNPEILKSKKLKWFVEITPTEKNVSELKRTLFINRIKEAQILFGIDSLNYEYLKKRFAIMGEENPQKFFKQMQPAMPQMGGQAPGQNKSLSDMVASRVGQSANNNEAVPNIQNLSQ